MNTVDENRVVKKKQSGKIRKKGQIDWMITLLPLGLIAALSILFFLLPEQSNTVLAKVRFFLGDTFGVYYLAIGLGVFLLSLYLACIFRKNCASVPEERSAIPLQTEQSSAG